MIPQPRFDDTPGPFPDFVQTASLLGSQGKYEEAIPLLEEALREHSSRADAYHLLGVLLEKRGDLDRAVHAFQKALAIDSASALTHFLLALIYRRQGQPGMAKAELRATLDTLNINDSDELVPFSDEIKMGYLRQFCEDHLRQLE